MSYVDGFLVPVPKSRLEEYREIAETAARVWKRHGALDYRECVVDDDHIESVRPFADASGASEDEVTVLAYIIYESREHRDEVNKKAMEDPDLICDMENPVFDFQRMAYAGFKTLVSF